jgi:hypothetical protein
MPLLQNSLASARRQERKLVDPLPKSKSRRKRQSRIPPRPSLLHQHDKIHPDNQLHPVFPLHPLLLRQSNLLVSSKKVLFEKVPLNKMPPKMFEEEIFPRCFCSG